MRAEHLHTPVSQEHLKALDGFRALLAVWVYLGHLSYATGYQNYLLGLHALAVDLFMVLSGFLMVRSWNQTTDRDTSFTHRVVQFYKKRFFRIAPLYYLLLFICWLFLPLLAEMSDFVQRTMPPPWAQGLTSYDPRAGWDFSSTRWQLLHATFTFGLVPGMESSSPLPDWSLSLEMQFYFVFPFLMLLLARVPVLLVAMLVAAIAFVSPPLFGNYLTPGSLAHFGQPSFLPYRLNAFFAGMLIAYFLTLRDSNKQTWYARAFALAGCAITVMPLSKPVIAAYLLFFALSSREIPLLTSLLSGHFMQRLGNMSYSIYLIHILIVLPVTHWMLSFESFLRLSALNRFIFAFVVSAPIVLFVSYLCFWFVERPFINLSKSLGKNK